MVAWIDRLGAILLDATLASTMLLSASVLFMVGCRQPVRRCLVARASLLGALAIIPLTTFRPISPLDVVGALRDLSPLPWLDSESNANLGWIGGTGVRVASWVISSALPSWLPRAIPLLYLLGVALSLGWIGFGFWASCWLVRTAREPSPSSRDLLAAQSRGGRFRRPRLLVSDRVRRPVLLGTLRPVILIPPELDGPGASEALRLSLLHELGHASRWDSLFCLVGALAQATWFFVPMLWWVREQMRLDQELLADRHASEDFGPFGSYASALVDLADPRGTASRSSPPSACRPLVPTGSKSSLILRVLMLVRCPFPVELRSPIWWRCSVPVIVAGATLLASSLTLRGDRFPHRQQSVSSRRPAHGTFQLDRLAIDNSKPPSSGAVARSYRLMCPLPEEFELTLDVWGAGPDLELVRVAGQRISPPLSGTVGSPLGEGYHHVRLIRNHATVSVWLDGQPVPPLADAQPIPDWLTVQSAPRQIGRFRNLVLTW